MTEQMTYPGHELEILEEDRPTDQALAEAAAAVAPHLEDAVNASVDLPMFDVPDELPVAADEAPPEDTEAAVAPPMVPGKPIQAGLRPGLRAGLPV